jgi:hypothetical protein
MGVLCSVLAGKCQLSFRPFSMWYLHVLHYRAAGQSLCLPFARLVYEDCDHGVHAVIMM